ncbi:unnamed protein product [Aphis gossypii]|uniref:Uncharacterized protein n=1 Tax=Aphis gossypii TaxID=80765 RepID=A0A9P0NJA0_APHGO|nr:unnamed protein product [Aphis gossypii]
MEQNKLIMVSLFGEDHYDSDEETIQFQQNMKHRIHDAFGSDSESAENSDILEIEYTDISDDEEGIGHHHIIPPDTRDNNKDKPKSFHEAKHIATQSVGRLQVIQTREKPVDQKKALAQYQRQIATRITKCQIQNNIRLHDSIVLTNKFGQPVKLDENDIVKDENKMIQEADKAIHGKNIIDTIMQFIPHQPEKNEEGT